MENESVKYSFICANCRFPVFVNDRLHVTPCKKCEIELIREFKKQASAHEDMIDNNLCCADCGNQLVVSIPAENGSKRIYPCRHCELKARDQVFDSAWSKGYDSGRAAGYEEGRLDKK